MSVSCFANLFLVLLPALANGSFRVIGGGVVDIKLAPYQASVLNFAKGSVCGGAIISQKVVLTAAHCFEKVTSASQLKVGAGSNQYNDVNKMYDVASYVIHKGYTSVTNGNDIAVVKIKGKFQWSPVIKPIALPPKNDVFQNNTVGIATGWGSTTALNSPVSEQLKAVRLLVLPQGMCDKFVGAQTPRGSFFCTKGGKNYEQSVCTGDSGGPFATQGANRPVLRGLVSWGKQCGRLKQPSVFTLVSYFLTFIQQNS